ncbi:MAG: BREX-1 system adenine-specific DNA-methyltransferase PglX, partial [Sphingomonadaceae bacterium]
MAAISFLPDSGIPQPVRRVLSRTILELRAALEEDYRKQLAALGVRENGVQPLPAGRVLSPADVRVREAAVAVIEQEVKGDVGYRDALDHFIRESAHTFLNRVFGMRCLEERGLLLVDGQSEQAIRVDPARGASSLYWRVRNEMPPSSNPREVWRETLRRAWTALSGRVRVLFDPDSEYVALLPLLPTLQRVMDALNSPEIPAECYAQDEFLGWVYQYYNAQEKDEVYARLRNGAKLEEPGEISAATCLYTERYMVDYLLQNTLGALWVQMHPESELPSRWPYFVRGQRSAISDQQRNHDSSPSSGEGQSEGVHSPPWMLPKRARDITLMDPACGSGHFLVRAFDMLVDMYREEGLERESEIPVLILERNLHGIDIDARAVQIAALALYIKGCDLAGPDFRPRRLNLIAADALLPGDEPPARYMRRFQGETEVEELVRGIWRGLKNVRSYGSLLHPERAVDEVVKRRRQREKGSYWEADDAHWEQWKRDLLRGIREQFEAESTCEDLGQRLFGQEAAKGAGLVEALGRRYDVVVANPPYQGSGSLDAAYKAFLARECPEGKRDLYAAFILRCMEFCHRRGRLGMVTQQSWMFLRSFAGLRKRVLGETSLETIAHLGPRAFEEIGGEVVSIALFTLEAARPDPEHRLAGFRLIGPKSASEKARLLGEAVAGHAPSVVSTPRQSDFVAIPETPFVYWLRPRFFELLQSDHRLRDVAEVKQGLATADNERFTRCFWEVADFGVVQDGKPVSGKWFSYAKGGRYQKWAGLEWLVVDWENRGDRVKQHSGSVVRNEGYYFR